MHVDDTTRRALGHYLKTVACARNLTQQALSRQTGIERTTISKIFQGAVKKPGHYHTIVENLGLGYEHAVNHALELHASMSTTEGRNMAAFELDAPAPSAPRIIAIVNKKGGVGKTTTSVNLAGGLHHIYDQRVLLVDLDSQGNSTKALSRNTDRGQGLAMAYELANEPDAPVLEPISTDTGIDVICGGAALARAERLEALAAFRLRRLIEAANLTHDYIILDTPPNFGVLTTSALMAADHVIIVTEPEPMSIDGIARVIASIQDARQSNRELDLLAIIPNKVRNRVVDRENLKLLRQGRWGDYVTRAHVRQNVSLVEPYYATQTIFDYDPSSNGARDFRALTREIWERIHG